MKVRFLRRLRDERRGAATIEMAILAPMFMALLFGVFQIGVGMQNYNAMRNVSADVARYAMVQYSTGNKLTETQLSSYAISRGRSSPYLLSVDRLNASVETATTQRVTGAKEMTLVIKYQIFSVLSSYGIKGPNLSYTRPIFVTTA